MRFSSPVFSSVIFLCVLVAAELGCGGGSASLQKNSSNPGQPQVPSINFSAQPSTVSSGASATLSWTSSNATAVTITGLGTFSASGSVQVTPAATTTYSAVASGPAGSTDTSVTVSVTGSPSPGPGPSPGPTPQPPPTSGVLAFSHVFVVVEENHGYSSVIGSSSMPYFNSLASRYAVATQYYADTHPSIGNYFMLTTGQTITNNDSFTGTVSADNIVRHLLTAGKTWKSYAENLPKTGYTGGDSYPYAKRHNPLSYFTDVVNSSTQVNNLVPFSQFSSDLANNSLPEFSFIVPNVLNDAHDGSLSQADSWLKTNIAPLISSSIFQNSLLVILFDEAETSDTSHGGGHVAAIVISPKSKKAYHAGTLYQHQSTLRLILEAAGVSSFPGAATNATNMLEFF